MYVELVCLKGGGDSWRFLVFGFQFVHTVVEEESKIKGYFGNTLLQKGVKRYYGTRKYVGVIGVRVELRTVDGEEIELKGSFSDFSLRSDSGT